jgi:Tfp pilus assembly protein PilN
MIEINLLPEQKKPAVRISLKGNELLLKARPFIAVFVLVHLILLVLGLNSYRILGQLNKRMAVLAPELEKLDDFNRKNDAFSKDTDAMNKLIGPRIKWAQKLDLLSSKLPYGIWFTEISLNEKSFTLRGSVISQEKEELTLIKEFIAGLKSDREYFGDFKDLDLNSVQSRDVSGYSVLDFLLTSNLK